MKKYLILLITLLMILLVGCNLNTSQKIQQAPRPEQPHLYWKDIDVVVTDIDKKTWFATTRWWMINIEVYSEEYDLTETFEIKDSGLYGCSSEWEYEAGDIIKAELHSWVIDSTGEVIRREISLLK